VITLKQHIQGEKIINELTPFCDDLESCKKIQNFRNRPLFVLRNLSYKLHSIYFPHTIHNNEEEGELQKNIVNVLHQHSFDKAIHDLGFLLFLIFLFIYFSI
jgi:hypothetical protein